MKVKARGGAERPAAAERAGEGAGALVWLPVAAGDPEGVDGDGVGDCPKSGAPDEGAGTGDALGTPGTETAFFKGEVTHSSLSNDRSLHRAPSQKAKATRAYRGTC